MHHNTHEDMRQYSFLTKTEEQARKVLECIFETYTLHSLKEELQEWLFALPEEVFTALESIPNLLQTHSINELLCSWKAKPSLQVNRYTHIGALFGCLFLFTDRCWYLFGNKLHEKQPLSWEFQGSEEYDTFIKEFIIYIDLDNLQFCLAEALRLAAGEEYIEQFRSKTVGLLPGDQQGIQELVHDQGIASRLHFMMLFAYMRSLLDTTFFYFGRQPASS